MRAFLSLALLLLVACEPAKKAPSSGSGGEAPVVAPQIGTSEKVATKALSSIEPASLEHCLEPPYFPKMGPADGGNPRWSATACEPSVAVSSRNPSYRVREVVLWPLKAGPDLSFERAQEVAESVSKQLDFNGSTYKGGVGLGVCCSGSPRLCVRVEVPLCGVVAATIEQAFVKALEETAAGTPALGLAIQTWGYVRPRCLPGDAECGPVPYNEMPAEVVARDPTLFALPYDPSLPRRVRVQRLPGSGEVVGLPKAEQLACDHDGDCVAGCRPWYDRRFSRGSRHVLYRDLLDAYCGCIESTCQYFESERPLVKIDFVGEVRDWGDGEQVVTEVLERHDMRRHMTRCFLGQERELPQAIEFSMTIPARGDRGVRVLAKEAPNTTARKCVLGVLGKQVFSRPPSKRSALVAGRLELSP